MGKGSKERPRSVPYDEYSKRWEAIFNNKEEEEEEVEPCPCGEDECGLRAQEDTSWKRRKK